MYEFRLRCERITGCRGVQLCREINVLAGIQPQIQLRSHRSQFDLSLWENLALNRQILDCSATADIRLFCGSLSANVRLPDDTLNNIGQAGWVECCQINRIYTRREFQSVVGAIERDVARERRIISLNRELVDLNDRFRIPDIPMSVSYGVVIDGQILCSNVALNFYCRRK